MTPARWRAALFGGALSLTACGGGAPLLHPAHTLPGGAVTFAAGTSGHFALGGLARAENDLDDPGRTDGSIADQRLRFTRGALVRAAAAPGVTPFVAARVGLGSDNEAGMTYTARTVRLDGRHAFEWDDLALSAGLVAIGALPRLSSRAPETASGVGDGARLLQADLRSTRGYGLELPLVFGYRSAADVVQVWTGVRAGLERDEYDFSILAAPEETLLASADAMRRWVGGLIGFSVGLAPIEVRVELDAAYEHVSGELALGSSVESGRASGLTLTPAMAISAEF